MRGYIQIYTGNGKGKTTAAIGLAIRASGSKLRTYIGQFMKGQEYGDIIALRDNPYIDMEQFGASKCVKKEDITPEYIAKTKKALKKCQNIMLSGNYEIVILDEINIAIWFGLLDEKDVLEVLNNKPDNIELILTGRHAPQLILDRADLITEMKCVKHYYDNGIGARKGIEN